MITVPVLIAHDYKRVIGELKINEKMLPSYPNYCFTLGYMITNTNTRGEVLEYELKEVSILPDHLYLEYLKANEITKTMV